MHRYSIKMTFHLPSLRNKAKCSLSQTKRLHFNRSFCPKNWLECLWGHGEQPEQHALGDPVASALPICLEQPGAPCIPQIS